MKIYDLIRNLRKEKKLTQQELADKVHVTVQTINQYESGKRQIKAEMLVSLLEALGYDFSIQEKFDDYETYGIFWDLSYYYEYWNSAGKMCSDFAGAVEISKADYQTLLDLIKNGKIDEASNLLEKVTRNIPGPMDAWAKSSYEQFLEYSEKEDVGDSYYIETTEDAEEEGEYNSGSFIKISKTLKSEILKVEPYFNRMVNY